MFVGFDNKVGTIIATDEVMDEGKYLMCDGRKIRRVDYPELFQALGVRDNVLRVPDMRGVLSGVSFYYIAKSPAG